MEDKNVEFCQVCKDPVIRDKRSLEWSRNWGAKRKAYCKQHKVYKQPI